MLNESAHLPSRRAAMRWNLGCAYAAARERVIYELEITVMKRRILKGLVGLGVVLIVGAVGIYVTAKPYQRDRIWITLQQGMHSQQR
jgi:hypothetical protein